VGEPGFGTIQLDQLLTQFITSVFRRNFPLSQIVLHGITQLAGVIPVLQSCESTRCCLLPPMSRTVFTTAPRVDRGFT
jgi:hypothetical protein